MNAITREHVRFGLGLGVSILIGACVILLVLEFTGCRREERAFRTAPPALSPGDDLRVSTLEPGPHAWHPPAKNAAEGNAAALNEGQRLFSAYNCVGCHAHGGGAIGPALMDSKWRYGSNPEQIFATIMEGRPNGMPSFRGKIPESQVWEIVGYVRSLSGLVPKDAAPSRDDHMKNSPPPNSVQRDKPVGEKAP